MNGSNTLTKIAGALLKAQRIMGDATKSSKNPFYKSSYADLNDIREVVTPALNSEGITVLQPTISLGDRNFVETILLHESGEFISGITEIKNADGKPQSEGSGISYARRYGLQSICNVGAVDDDGEVAQGRTNAWSKEVKVTEVQEKSKTVSGTNGTVNSGHAVSQSTQKVVSTSTQSAATSLTPAIKDLITAAFKVLEKQGVISAAAFKTNYLNGKGLSTVLPSELVTIYAKMKKDYPQLSGKGN